MTSNPIEAAAQAAYAASPIPEIPVSAFKVKGGLLFADGPVNKTVTKALPRGAFSYLLNERTNLRGGFGLFSYDYFFENINQAGYSQATPVLVTNDNGLTFTGATLANPIPSGQLLQPVGDALGLAQPARTEPRHAVSARSRRGLLPPLGSEPAARLARRLGDARSPTSARAA